MRILTLALIEGDATIQLPDFISEKSFIMLLGILKLQKPALVSPPEEEEDVIIW